MLTHLKLWDSGEDEHDDGGQEEEGADDDQHLEQEGKVESTSIYQSQSSIEHQRVGERPRKVYNNHSHQPQPHYPSKQS